MNMNNITGPSTFTWSSNEFPEQVNNATFELTYNAARDGNLQVLEDNIHLMDHYVNKRHTSGATMLTIAVQNGRFEVVRFLVSNWRAIVNNTNAESATPLYIAAMHRHFEIADFLLDWGAEIDRINSSGATLLHIAAEHGRLDIVKFLLDRRADVNKGNSNGVTPLHIAAENGHLEVVRCLIDAGRATVNRGSYRGFTPVGMAIQKGHFEIVRFLRLERGATIESLMLKHLTQFYVAANPNHSDVARFLVQVMKSEINMPNSDGVTPLFIAAQHGFLEDVTILFLDGRADVNIPNRDGATPLYIAAMNGHTEVVQFLIDIGDAEVNRSNNRGTTPFEIALQNGHFEVVRLLEQNPTLDKSQLRHRLTSCYIAESSHHEEMARFLVQEARSLGQEGGTIMNMPNRDGDTPLFIAAKHGLYHDVMIFMQEPHTDVNLPNAKGTTPLYIAALNGHIEIVQYLVETGKADVNTTNCAGMTPLEIAIEKGHFGIVRFLMQEGGATIDLYKLRHGYTPLYAPENEAHTDVAKFLVQVAGPRINMPNKDHATPLFIAAQNGFLADVVIFIEGKAQVNLPNTNGATPLYIAAQNGHIDVVRYLIVSGGANVNTTNSEGMTALEIAIKGGHFNIVRFLLAAGATIDPIDLSKLGQQALTLLYVTENVDHTKVAKLLVQAAGPTINMLNPDGDTPLFIAAQNGFLEDVVIFVEGRAQVNIANSNGTTPLFIAAQNGHIDVVRHLIETGGANVNTTNREGMTALEIAIQRGHFEVVRFLILKGRAPLDITKLSHGLTSFYVAENVARTEVAELLVQVGGPILNMPNKDGATPLFIAAQNGFLEDVVIFVEGGAPVNFANTTNGATPLFIAVQNGHIEVVQYLIETGNAEVHTFNRDGLTAFEIARDKGHLEVFLFLLQKGAGAFAKMAVIEREQIAELAKQLVVGMVDTVIRQEVLTNVVKLARTVPKEIKAILEGMVLIKQKAALSDEKLNIIMYEIYSMAHADKMQWIHFAQPIIDQVHQEELLSDILFCLILVQSKAYREMCKPSPEVLITLSNVLAHITDHDIARKLALYIYQKGHGVLWNGQEEPLIKTAISVITVTTDLAKPLNPYTLYQRLKVQAREPLVHLSPLEKVGNQTVRWDPTRLQEKTRTRIVLSRDICPTNPRCPEESPQQTFAALVEHSLQHDGQLLAQALRELDLTQETVSAFAKDPYLHSLMIPYSSPEEVVPFDVVQWRCILRFLASLEKTAVPLVLSQQAATFFAVVKSINFCPAGKREGMTIYYNLLPHDFKLSTLTTATMASVGHVQNLLWETYQQQLNTILSNDNELLRRLTNKEQINQLSHQALYLKNAVGIPFWGAAGSITFDLNSHTIIEELAQLPREKILEHMDLYWTPSRFVAAVETELQRLMPEQTTKEQLRIFHGLQQIIGYACEPNGYWENVGTTDHQRLTEAGVCALLLKEGYFFA